MKKILFVAAIAALVSSCGEKFDKFQLTDELVVLNVHDAEPKLYGVQDLNGQEILPMQFTSITLEDNMLLTISNEGQALYNLKGELLFGSSKELAKDGILWADKTDGMVRYYNPEKDKTIGPYTRMIKLSTAFIVYRGELQGLVSFDNEEIIKVAYEELYLIQDDQGAVAFVAFDKAKNRYQRFDHNGKPVRTYSPKFFKRWKKSALSSWEYGFTVKKL